MKSRNHKTWFLIVSVTALATIIGLIFFGALTVKKVNRINESWSTYSEKATTINLSLLRLTGAIGYGGFIHDFKNYILRHDAAYKTRAETNIAEILTIIDKLAPDFAAAEEHKALNAIKGVVLNYGEMLAMSGEMVAEGRSTVEIDSIVKIDDKPALDAFTYLLELTDSRNRKMEAQADFELQSTIKFLSFGVFLALGVVGTAVLILAFIRKIAAANTALSAAYDRIDLLFDSAPDPMISIRSDGSIARYNAQAEAFFGYTQAEVTSMTVEDFIPEKFREKHKTYRAKYTQSPKYRLMGGGPELTAQTKDGRQPLTEISLSHSGGGGDALTTITVRDITERRRNEKAILQAKEEAEKANRALEHHQEHLEEVVTQRTHEVQEKAIQLETALMREKEYNVLQRRFVALVSHEFRTPLAIIDGTAQRLIRRKDKLDANDIEMRANKVRSAVERMIGLIDTTLYASQLDAGKIEMKRSSNDIGELLLDVCERQAEIAPDHQFDVEVKHLPKEMLIDHGLIDQVFTNLVSNAVKYAPLAPHVEVKGWQENRYVIVTVADHGVGIPKDELPHMFTRFFRASTAEGYKGTGLGLSVCKEFVEMHGGTIEIVSVEGQGTTLTVRLPIDENGR